MVTTVLEATVAQEKWSLLEETYRGEATQLPPQMVSTSLLQGTKDRTIWQIVSVWKSREALEEMRSSEEIPAGIRMFRMTGAEPSLTVYDVLVSATI